MTFADRVAADRLLARTMGAPAPAATLRALRSRATAMPLGLVETPARRDPRIPRGRFELQDAMVGDHDDERTLLFVAG